MLVACVATLCGCSQSEKVEKRVENLAKSPEAAYHVEPLERAVRDESWLEYGALPTGVRRFLFVPQGAMNVGGTGMTFAATIVMCGSVGEARDLWARSGALVQTAGKMTKDFGSDEMERWGGQLTGRWNRAVVVVYAQEENEGHGPEMLRDDAQSVTSEEEWTAVMGVIAEAVREGDW
jgi:hypothetical protein